MLTVKFEEDGDARRYTMVAIRGTGACTLNVTGLCKSQDHKHECVTRQGYAYAADWASQRQNEGYKVLSMDRTY